MKAKITTEPAGIVPYTNVSNHISTEISELLDYIAKNRWVSRVIGSTPIQGILISKGDIFTGHYDNCQELSQ